MKTVILHVGMHKTGSTSIQKSLKAWRERDGVRYVDLGVENHGHAIVPAFLLSHGSQGYSRDVRMGRSRLEVVIRKFLTLWRLRRELSRPDIQTFVISGEGIPSLPIEALQELKATLLRFVDRVVVFAYLRDPVGYSVSMFQQQVKSGKAHYKLDVARYRQRFEKCLEVFGHENFVARVFDPAIFPKGSVVADFCSQWNIPFDGQYEERVNESLSGPAVQLLHLFNRSGVQADGSWRRYMARRRLVMALTEHFKDRGKFSLPPCFLDQTLAHPDEMAWVKQQWGIRFTLPPLCDEALPRQRLRAFLTQLDPIDVASYCSLLEGLSIPASLQDTPAELVCRHYEFLYRRHGHAILITRWFYQWAGRIAKRFDRR